MEPKENPRRMKSPAITETAARAAATVAAGRLREHPDTLADVQGTEAAAAAKAKYVGGNIGSTIGTHTLTPPPAKERQYRCCACQQVWPESKTGFHHRQGRTCGDHTCAATAYPIADT